LIQVYDKINN